MNLCHYSNVENHNTIKMKSCRDNLYLFFSLGFQGLEVETDVKKEALDGHFRLEALENQNKV